MLMVSDRRVRMAKEHKVITDPEIHEPKGASTATSGQVYESDGAGSGVWVANSGAALITRVESLADMATPVAGVITVPDNVTYHASGIVALGANVVTMGLNSCLCGSNRLTDGFSSTSTNPMITANQSSSLRELQFSCANADFLALSGSAAETFIITDSFLTACNAVGTVNNWRTTVFRSFSVTQATAGGLNFTGTGSAFNMDNSLWANFTAGTMLNFGSVVFDRLQVLGGNRFNAASGVTVLSGLASSGNVAVGGFGIVSGNIFEGAGTYLNNITSSDVRWEFVANGNVTDSQRAATGATKAQVTTTSTSTTPVKLDVGTSFVADIEDQFTVDNTGRITYNGQGPMDFQVDSTVLFDTGSGSNQLYYFYVAKNGTPVQASVGAQEFDSTDPQQVGLNGVVSLSATDYVEIYVEKATSTGTDLAHTLNIVVR
jgi:hypothetical protein